MSVACVEARVERLWQLEEPPNVMSHQLEFPIEQVGTQYQVGRLWRSDRRPPENYTQAMAEATKPMDRLNVKGKRQQYDNVLMREYSELGAIERRPNPEQPGYYMPHHAIFREHAATIKTRVAFNASASATGKSSLNDLLSPGPSLLPDLVGLLLRFREYPFALEGDIRKAFFMIGIREEDRPYFRFVWPELGESEMCVWRLTKSSFGANCSSFILNAVLLHHLDRLLECANDADRAMCLRCYVIVFCVDDSVVSVSCPAQADYFRECSVVALQGAGMDLRKWHGNTIVCDPESGGNVLGVGWEVDDDVIAVAAVGDTDTKESPGTRRQLLHCAVSVFDPPGLAAPAVLPGKILLQGCWKLGSTWDQPLPSEIAAKCAQWWGDVSNVLLVKVLWRIGGKPNMPVTLHVFADASEKGYGYCIYIVVDGVACLLCGKSKVAPVSAPTLARLQLEAVCLASSYLSFVCKELRVKAEGIFGWTDSLTTLQWTMNPSYCWKTLVDNRVVAVQQTAKERDVK